MSESRAFRDILPTVELRVASPSSAEGGLPPGSRVKRGEPFMPPGQSAPAVISPMDGTVGASSEVMLTSGKTARAFSVTIDPIGSQDSGSAPSGGAATLAEILRDAKPADLSRHVDALRLAGVWADRWTSPDLLGQLHQCLKRPVDMIVCNALDFDDALPLQQSVICEFPLEVAAAMSVLAALTGATRAAVAVDAAVAETCTSAFRRVGAPAGVRTVGLRNDYPQSNPTLLLHALARRHLRPGHLPTDAGVVLLDAAAAAAVGRALLYDQSATNAPIGVADLRPGSLGRPLLLNVPIGMSVADVLRTAGAAPSLFELRASSPVRELTLAPDCVISAGGELALYLVAPQPLSNPAPCIRCGWCGTGCPVHIHPAGILQAAQSDDRVAGERHGLESCIECGICSYVCPSFLPLLGGIRSLRAMGRDARS